MTETPVAKLIIRLGIPTTVSMLVTNIYNMADTYFVGKINTSASGAVGIVFGLMAIIQAIGFMFGHGAGSIMSRKLGKRDVESASHFASTAFAYSFLFGAAITVVGILLITPLMRLLGSTDTILPYAKTYAYFILAAAPLMTTSFVMNNLMRYEGKASLAMIGLTAGGFLNIFGDWFFMTRCHMGIAGAGLSTALSQLVSFLLLLSMFVFKKTECRLAFRYVSRSFKDVTLIMRTGLSSLMRQTLSSVSTMVLNGAASAYGDAAVSAMTIVGRICFFVFAVGLGIGQGYQPVCAFNFGAGKYSRVKKGFHVTLIMGESLLSVLAVIGLVFSDSLVGIFRNDPAVIEIGSFALKIQLVSLFFQPLCTFANMMFQSIGKTGAATFLSSLRSGLIFIPALLLLSHFLGLFGVELAQSVSDVIAFFVALPFVIIFIKSLPPDLPVSEQNPSLSKT